LGGVQAGVAGVTVPRPPPETPNAPPAASPVAPGAPAGEPAAGPKRKRAEKLEQWCLTCGITTSDYWQTAGLGLRVMVTLVLGGAHRHFDDESASLCRACSRACGAPAAVAACEALVLSAPALSGQQQMRLDEAQLDGLRDSLRLLRDDFARRSGVVLLERLLALDLAAWRQSTSGLVLLPVPPSFEVSISNRCLAAPVSRALFGIDFTAPVPHAPHSPTHPHFNPSAGEGTLMFKAPSSWSGLFTGWFACATSSLVKCSTYTSTA
jgi:hypothetical protein